MMSDYTHVGYNREAGSVHTGRLYGHGDYRGKWHALHGHDNPYSGDRWKAVCGETVVLDHDGDRFNVQESPDQRGSGVSCKRCRRLIETAVKQTAK